MVLEGRKKIIDACPLLGCIPSKFKLKGIILSISMQSNSNSIEKDEVGVSSSQTPVFQAIKS